MSMPLRARGALLLAILWAAAMGYYHQAIFLPHARLMHTAEGLGNGYFFGNDFYPIWLTSREWAFDRRDPYSPELTRAIQVGLFGRSLDPGNPLDPDAGYRTFSYPAFTDIVALPLAGLHFATARVLLVLFFPPLLALAVLLWVRFLGLRTSPERLAILIILTLFSYPGLEAVFALQWGLLVQFLVAASVAAMGKNRTWSAGCWLALATIKPQLIVLLVFYLLLWTLADWRGRRGFAYGFLGGTALLATSALLISPHWIFEWLHVLSGYRKYTYPPLARDLWGPHGGSALMAGLLVAALALAWRMRHVSAASGEFALTVSVLLAISVVTLLPSDAVYDHLLLLPGIVFLLRFWRRLVLVNRAFRILLALSIAALAWPGIAAMAVIGMRLVQPLAGWAILLPVRTAASMPFVILAALGLAMREWLGRRMTLASE
jgi:hypothetical protein